MIKATFFMEQHIGHRAYYDNLRRHIDCAREIEPTWIEVTYHSQHSLWQQLPGIPSTMRGALVGRDQTRCGLKKSSNILFFNTQVPAVIGGPLRRPYIIATDITPIQYDQMASFYNHHPDRSYWITRWKKVLNQSVLQNAAVLLPWSSWAGSSMIEDYGVDPARVEVLPPGVDLDLWRPKAKSKGVPFRILFVGGDFERKGGNDLLQAFRQLPGSASGQVELALVTRSPLPPEPGIKIYSDLFPNSPELIRLYQSSHLFVLPSRAEAFGIAAVEASAVGLPVIAAHIGGLADIVADGITGYQIEPGNVQQLQSLLYGLMDDDSLRTGMGEAARSRAEQYFDASKNADRLLDIMADVVHKG
jgi:glycosyltransferase involved in cell wall biosynthesis